MDHFRQFSFDAHILKVWKSLFMSRKKGLQCSKEKLQTKMSASAKLIALPNSLKPMYREKQRGNI